MEYDLFIIGGGVNGVGIARDAAGRGLKVGLCERDDLGAHTSSASTKLIHGGLRYLEQYEFRLVRESLREREVLLAAAPHIIWPLEFVLPHHTGLRPKWVLRLGLFLYDRLGGHSSLPRTKRIELSRPPYSDQLRSTFKTGFVYSDCWVDDARLVVLNAVDAVERGAHVMTRTECISLSRRDGNWKILLKGADGDQFDVQARVIINAAGPWVDQIDARAFPQNNRARTRLVKGSHIVTRKLYDGDHAYIFQNTDGRIVFTIPYEHEYTLIGTTDIAVDAPEEGRATTPDEEAYLRQLANAYFANPISKDDIVWRYSGVRALFDNKSDNASKVTRDYTLSLDADGPPILSVYGGKLTTYRKLAEHALAKLSVHLPEMEGPWTKGVNLPGGEFRPDEFHQQTKALKAQYSFTSNGLIHRLTRAYGTRARSILGEAQALSELGVYFGADLYERELEYLRDIEFAKTAEDVLWRRSKLGLKLSSKEHSSIANWFNS